VAVVDPRSGVRVDEALCVVMRGPGSYTGEDVVELSCHGSPAVLRLVIDRLVETGARLAAPGEFTRRAFLNGRLGLAEAEAVALVIGARTERAVALAARALAGGLSAPLRALRESLLAVVAALEVTLDFPDDAVGLATSEALALIARMRTDVARLRTVTERGRVAYEGLTAAIVGPPNAGKSSLLNALLGRDRAIVSPLPGTTRDVVEGTLAVRGIPVRLLDTAGLTATGNLLEAEGVRRSRAAADESHLLVVVSDGQAAPDAGALAETRDRPRIVVASKSDLPRHPGWGVEPDAVRVSALTGAGLDALLARLGDEVAKRVAEDGEEGGLVTSLRQAQAIEALDRTLGRAESALLAHPIEIALVDLREALANVSALLGVGVDDAVLDRIFSTFCLGK
jgi:tRNA modification GTPase